MGWNYWRKEGERWGRRREKGRAEGREGLYMLSRVDVDRDDDISKRGILKPLI